VEPIVEVSYVGFWERDVYVHLELKVWLELVHDLCLAHDRCWWEAHDLLVLVHDRQHC